jgi:hypothetical protein
VRTSDLIIGAVALLPAALKVGRDVKRQLETDAHGGDERAA